MQLPPSATYKVMLDKLSEYGDVKFMEEKGQGSVLVIYGSDWQAESAYSILFKFSFSIYLSYL